MFPMMQVYRLATYAMKQAAYNCGQQQGRILTGAKCALVQTLQKSRAHKLNLSIG